MAEMSKEMMKAGIIDEMINDTMDSVLDEEGDLDNIADAEVTACPLFNLLYQ